MRLDTIETWVRRAGAVGAFLFLVAMYLGLWRGSRRPKGRKTGYVPALVQGSFSVLLPASLAGFGLLYWLQRPLPWKLSRPARIAALAAGALLYFPGVALMLWGRLTLGEMYGVSTSLGVQLYAGHRLVTSGPYALVRHPMYLGGQMAELGALLLYRTWATLLIALNIPVLLLRARREEAALAAEFGDAWADYRQRVPAWLPRFRR